MTGKSSDAAAGHLVGQDADWAEISDTLYGRGFQETSWSQDITASFAFGSARIFIHPANREDREDSGEGSLRFFVTEDTTSFEFATDDLHEAIEVAQIRRRKMKTQTERIKYLLARAAEFAEMVLNEKLFGRGPITDGELAKAAIDYVLYLEDASLSLSLREKGLLGSLTTRDDAGRHFTQLEKYTPEFLEKMERLGLIVIHKPVHTESGVAFSEEYWQIESPACVAQFFQEESK